MWHKNKWGDNLWSWTKEWNWRKNQIHKRIQKQNKKKQESYLKTLQIKITDPIMELK